MTTYIVHNANGDIIRCMIQQQAPDLEDGQSLIEDNFITDLSLIDWASKKVEGGVLVDRVDYQPDMTLPNREERDHLLTATDWTQVPDSPLTDTQKTAWRTYRQSLRDLTTHSNWPNLNDEDWPSPPA